ncbi:hypothetical protein HPP92_016664 [Vanilla planifolia]|uniref:Uncharacterized protein n=1 Tax=Vanilla planifolia TaxID=51239 RepID=A0A835USA3_VANPL|nr:hypothetical protein HPP92_016664 [Vanilla planifolia]
MRRLDKDSVDELQAIRDGKIPSSKEEGGDEIPTRKFEDDRRRDIDKQSGLAARSKQANKRG